jgi:hypothetical protein
VNEEALEHFWLLRQKRVGGEETFYEDLYCATCFVFHLLPAIMCLGFLVASQVRNMKTLVRTKNMI